MATESVEQLAIYRHLITLQNGMRVLLRPLLGKDRDSLVALFSNLTADETIYYRDDVVDSRFAPEWAENIDYTRVFPLVAVLGDRIVGSSTLHLGRLYTRHVAQIRLYLGKEYRHCGIGKAMINAQIEIARRMGLRQIIAEVVESQPQVIHGFENLGFERMGVFKDMFMTPDGNTLDMIMLVYYLKRSVDEF